jgi:transposase InsO family protein
MGNTCSQRWVTVGMTWHVPDLESQRLEFVQLAQQRAVRFTALCERFRISTKTGYKWLERYRQQGVQGLKDRSRRPRSSPKRCAEPVQEAVLALYAQWGWGGRKLRRRLLDLGWQSPPAASTCTAILHRTGAFAGRTEPPAGPLRRFCREQPNALWQLDFKGDFATQSGRRCYPLAAIDDHSRFNVLLEPSANQQGGTVREALERALQRYGLPEELPCDNGPPWGSAEPVCPYTTLTVWLLQLGIRVIHGRPYHPQTQGKQERFHRTLQRELLSRHTWQDLEHCAACFREYRRRYNSERPHDELGGDTPMLHYRPSPRTMPASLPRIEYPPGTDVRRLRTGGILTVRGQTWYVGRAFNQQSVGLRPSPQTDGLLQVWFSHHLLGHIDLNSPSQPKHTLRSIYCRA